MEALSQATAGDIPNTKQVAVLQETLDNPFDVTLVVEDGKEFKAHRRVLSEASPFFERLLNSDMKESKEGVIRLEILTDVGMREILEFIYTGSVQISAEDKAIELIRMADYLVLSSLKTVAGKFLGQYLNILNAISIYCLADIYGCEELLTNTTNFMFANFTAVTKTEGFLNLSGKEVKMLISSDQIVVSSEEDVFKAILTWIDHDNGNRKKYFAELFREVRLVCVSRDYLQGVIATIDLVNDNEGCMGLVKDAVEFMGPKHKTIPNFSVVKPRKSYGTPVIVTGVYYNDNWNKESLMCYYPREGAWSKWRGTVPWTCGSKQVSCRGKLYSIPYEPNDRLFCYDSFSDNWKSLAFEEQWGPAYHLFVINDEIYAFVYAAENIEHELQRFLGRRFRPCSKKLLSCLTKYKPETNSWKDVTSFDLGLRSGICVLAKENFVYFLGDWKSDGGGTLSDADRYDFSTNTWDKISDLQEPRCDCCGAAVSGKIFILGGRGKDAELDTCEVYHETTNEWHFIANLKTGSPDRTVISASFSADGKLYILKQIFSATRQNQVNGIIESYDAVKNEWYEMTEIPLFGRPTFCCLMTVFKGSDMYRKTLLGETDKRKCAVM